jgi:DNA-binding transcriptional ArsR family regulator
VLHSGPKSQEWIVKGASDIADQISMQGKTLMTHARDLAKAGLISYERDGMKKYRFHLLHCPVKGLNNEAVQIPAKQPRARKTSRPPVPRKTNLVSREKHVSNAVDPVAKTEGLSKYAKRYEGIEESHQWFHDQSQYYQEGPKCVFSGCQELVRGHTFCDHEPVWPENILDEEMRADDVAKLILKNFPGAELMGGPS